jgi:hypothetical protein
MGIKSKEIKKHRNYPLFLQTLDAYQKEDGMQQIHAEKILMILFIHMIFYILSC